MGFAVFELVGLACDETSSSFADSLETDDISGNWNLVAREDQ